MLLLPLPGLVGRVADVADVAVVATDPAGDPSLSGCSDGHSVGGCASRGSCWPLSAAAASTCPYPVLRVVRANTMSAEVIRLNILGCCMCVADRMGLMDLIHEQVTVYLNPVTIGKEDFS